MKTIIKRGIPLVCALCLLFLSAPPAEGYVSPVTTLKIGLYYGGDALSAANLLNYVGSGYEFGYFDDQRQFIGLDSTGETAITMTSPGTGRIRVSVTNTDRVLFEYDCSGPYPFGVRPVSTGEKTQTWFKGYKYYGAFQYTRNSNGNLTVVNVVNIEDYIKGVVPYEMSASWHIEALKAQALCARTYAAARISSHKSAGFDLCASTDCQVYHGTNAATANSDAAVEATAGQYVLHNNAPAETYYHSSDGGATENSENVWNEALPYLRGVLDPYEKTVSTGYDSWSYTYTRENVTWILQQKGYSCGSIVSITPIYTALGNIYSLTFRDSNGKSFTFSKELAGFILNSSTLEKYTHSQRFTVSAPGSAPVTPGSGTDQVYVNGSGSTLDIGSAYAIGGDGTILPIGGAGLYVITGEGLSPIGGSGSSGTGVGGTLSGAAITSDTFVVSGSGWGHNIGMSQYGAKAMAQAGYTYDQILKFYFTGVTIG